MIPSREASQPYCMWVCAKFTGQVSRQAQPCLASLLTVRKHLSCPSPMFPREKTESPAHENDSPEATQPVTNTASTATYVFRLLTHYSSCRPHPSSLGEGRGLVVTQGLSQALLRETS